MRLSEKKSLLKKCMPVIAVVILAASCSKNNNSGSGETITTPGTANIAVVNASPTSAMYNVYSDSTNLTPNSQLGFGSATGVTGGNPYVSFVTGDSLKLSSNGTTYVVDSNFNFVNNGYYTVFAYDTAGSSGQLRTLILNDPSAVPASGQAEIRFINLSSNSVPLNVSFIDSTDTIRQTNISYVGMGLITADSLSTFTSITPGTYDVQVRDTLGTLITDAGSHSFSANGVYTLYAKGFQNGNNGTDSLSVGIIQNR